MRRVLVAEDSTTRTWEIRGDDDKVLGTDSEERLAPELVNADTLRVRSRLALNANATFLAIATPTNAQVTNQVTALTKECSALIRLLLGALDSTAGT